MVNPEIVQGSTYHRRRGEIRHAFRHRVDFVLLDPETTTRAPLFGRNRWAVASVHDSDHGGPRRSGEGAGWARRVLAEAGAPAGLDLLLLTQPRWLGTAFNPVSFWLAFRDEALVAVIAEVNNTYGDRHNYLCVKPGFTAIGPRDVINARKAFHVSPFQEVAGGYGFTFDIGAEAISIRILYRSGAEGLIATLDGKRRPMTAPRVLRAAARFPFAGLRAITLIHWQALRLRLKGAAFRPRPLPPPEDVSR